MPEGTQTPRFKRYLQVVVNLAALMLIFFGSAGRLNIPRAWIYFLIFFAYLLVMAVALRDPGLLNERATRKKDLRPWDVRVLIVYAVALISSYVVAGLDVGRFGWSPPVPIGAAVAAFAVFTSAMVLLGWALFSNTFFSTVVRIQTERDHSVATGGPYRYMRHPGYTAMISSFLAMPVAIGSLWALVPAFVAASALIIRTYLEDRVLQAELDGYVDYATRVRFRLVPGLW